MKQCVWLCPIPEATFPVRSAWLCTQVEWLSPACRCRLGNVKLPPAATLTHKNSNSNVSQPNISAEALARASQA